MPSIVHVIALLLGMVVGWLGMSAISSMFGNNKVQKESEAFSKNMLEELTKEITKEESNESKAKTGRAGDARWHSVYGRWQWQEI